MRILGIHDGHNATACLMIEGKAVALISEERFTYVKNDMGLPVNAIRECLKIGGISASDLDEVAFATINMSIHYLKIKRECKFSVKDWTDEQEDYWKPKLFENRINLDYFKKLYSRKLDEQAYDFSGLPPYLAPEENKKEIDRIRKEALERIFGIPPSKVSSYDHHSCHANYGYFGSPFRGEKALVFTSDGGGDFTNGTVSIVEEDKLTELGRNNCSDVGRIYRYITLMLGMKPGEHEFKVMGLAPYCSEYEMNKARHAFKDVFHVPDILIEYKNKPSDCYFHFKEKLKYDRFDGISAAAQEMTEIVGTEWVSKVCRRYGIGRIVVSGGLAMNVKMNKVISELPEVKEMYIAASPGDESLALGACYIANSRMSTNMGSVENNYLGHSYGTDAIMAAVSKLDGVEIRTSVTSSDVAKLLADNLIIGRFAGRMEFGARSLGNRSIIANPSNQAIVRKINEAIKFRDFWMPFAPSILHEHTGRYIINPKGIRSDHMTICFDTTELGKKHLVAALHPYDYTVRPQIVRKELNPLYHELISEFEKLTGIGAVLNTSFNLHGYPIVGTPEYACHVFKNSKLDAILLEDVLVIRRS